MRRNAELEATIVEKDTAVEAFLDERGLGIRVVTELARQAVVRIFEPSEWAVGTVRLGVLVSRRRRRPQPQGGRRTRVFGQRASKSSESSGSASRNRPASKWRQSSMAKPRASFRLVGATSTMVTAQRRSFPAFVSPLPPARSSQHLQQRLRLRIPAPRPSSRPLRKRRSRRRRKIGWCATCSASLRVIPISCSKCSSKRSNCCRSRWMETTNPANSQSRLVAWTSRATLLAQDRVLMMTPLHGVSRAPRRRWQAESIATADRRMSGRYAARFTPGRMA